MVQNISLLIELLTLTICMHYGFSSRLLSEARRTLATDLPFTEESFNVFFCDCKNDDGSFKNECSQVDLDNCEIDPAYSFNLLKEAWNEDYNAGWSDGYNHDNYVVASFWAHVKHESASLKALHEDGCSSISHPEYNAEKCCSYNSGVKTGWINLGSGWCRPKLADGDWESMNQCNGDNKCRVTGYFKYLTEKTECQKECERRKNCDGYSSQSYGDYKFCYIYLNEHLNDQSDNYIDNTALEDYSTFRTYYAKFDEIEGGDGQSYGDRVMCLKRKPSKIDDDDDDVLTYDGWYANPSYGWCKPSAAKCSTASRWKCRPGGYYVIFDDDVNGVQIREKCMDLCEKDKICSGIGWSTEYHNYPRRCYVHRKWFPFNKKHVEIGFTSGSTWNGVECTVKDKCDDNVVRRKKYYGRGSLQLSHYSGYKGFGDFLKEKGKVNQDHYFLGNADAVATDDYAWMSGLWYFTDSMVTVANLDAQRTGYNGYYYETIYDAFKMTIERINGPKECNPSGDLTATARKRAIKLKDALQVLGEDVADDIIPDDYNCHICYEEKSDEPGTYEKCLYDKRKVALLDGTAYKLDELQEEEKVHDVWRKVKSSAVCCDAQGFYKNKEDGMHTFEEALKKCTKTSSANPPVVTSRLCTADEAINITPSTVGAVAHFWTSTRACRNCHYL